MFLLIRIIFTSGEAPDSHWELLPMWMKIPFAWEPSNRWHLIGMLSIGSVDP